MLRFLAFFAVYLNHSLSHDPHAWLRYRFPAVAANLMAAIARAGRFGVTLFFMLTSFLITSLLLREKELRGGVNISSFYMRRILRIFPLYVFALALAALWPLREERMPLSYLAAYLVLAGNWMAVFFGLPSNFMSILWTVSVGEQFNVIWSLAVRRFTSRLLLVIAIVLILAPNLARIYLATHSIQSFPIWPTTFLQLEAFGTGILCALFFRCDVPKFQIAVRLLFLVGLILLVCCGYALTTNRMVYAVFAFPAATLGCLFLFLAMYGAAFRVGLLVYLGKISYGLYVYHILALTLIGWCLGGRAGTPLRFGVYWFGGLLLTGILAALSYRYIQAPFLRAMERFTIIETRPV